MQISFEKGKKLAVLIDPDKFSQKHYSPVIQLAKDKKFDFFLVGGSLTFNPIGKLIDYLHKHSHLPVILFPGDIEQVNLKADAILFLSLLSGRNSEYLIGKHILVAKKIKDSKIQVIPTGYILISSGKKTSVEYITQTHAIPSDKSQLAVATAIAGELLGMKLIYLEAGSNAEKPIPLKLIKAVKKNINIPLMVGGGIRSVEYMQQVYEAGADVVVISSVLEDNPNLIFDFVSVLKK